MELTNTRTRKRSHDEDNHAYNNCMTDVTEQSMDSRIKRMVTIISTTIIRDITVAQ